MHIMFGDKISSAFLHYSTNGFLNLIIILATDPLNIEILPPILALTPLLIYIYRREVLDINSDPITEMIIGYFSFIFPYIFILPGLSYARKEEWKNAYKK